MAAFGVFVIAYLGFALGPSVVAVGVLLVCFALQGAFRAGGKALATDLILLQLRGNGIGLCSATLGLTGVLLPARSMANSGTSRALPARSAQNC